MAVTLQNAVTAVGNATTFTGSINVTGNDRLMTFDIEVEGAGVHATAVSFNGVAATFLDSQAHANGQCETWYLVAPAVGNFSFSVTISAAANAVIGVRSWNGVQQTTPITNHSKATGSISPATASVVSSAGGVVIDNLAVQKIPISQVITPDPSQTQDWNLSQGPVSSGVVGGGSHKAATGGTDTMTWTLSASAQWAILVVAIRAKIKNVSAAPSLTVTAAAAGPRTRDSALLARISSLERDRQKLVRRVLAQG